MIDWLSQPWPWYVAGPMIGSIAALLLALGGRSFGISSNLRHLCAATLPGQCSFLRYDWRLAGWWNLLFIVGVMVGGLFAALALPHPETIAISEATQADLATLGISVTGFVPAELYGLSALTSAESLFLLIAGGFLVGFGARYAGGCTSGHAITGLANLQLPSLVAVLGFFAGGLFSTHVLLPVLLGG